MNSTRLTEVDGRLSLNGYEFSCGEPIVVLVADVEVSGWVEYSHNDMRGYTGWYLIGRKLWWCPLVAGMYARRVV